MAASVLDMRSGEIDTRDRHVVVDCETTGFSHRHDRIVSFAAVELSSLKPTGRELHFICNPGRSSHPGALAVHGLNDMLLAMQPAFASRAEEVAEFLAGAILVGHNLSFDLGFLQAEFKRARRCALEFGEMGTVCTLNLYREHFDGGADLDQATARFGIALAHGERRHDALSDARATATLLACLLNRGTTERTEKVSS